MMTSKTLWMNVAFSVGAVALLMRVPQTRDLILG